MHASETGTLAHRLIALADRCRTEAFAECSLAEAVESAMRDAARVLAPSQPEWFMCFGCWQAYYVPTTGYYGKCMCGNQTVPWPCDPREMLQLIEWRRAKGSSNG
jgi:hypothetical protein